VRFSKCDSDFFQRAAFRKQIVEMTAGCRTRRCRYARQEASEAERLVIERNRIRAKLGPQPGSSLMRGRSFKTTLSSELWTSK